MTIPGRRIRCPGTFRVMLRNDPAAAALYLTDFGRENTDSFIELLNSRDDVISAERDYMYSYTTTLLKG